jgi:hypothetical protein
MAGSGQVERLWWTRLRWRMRGAWLWPTFFALTFVDGVLLSELPFYGSGPGGFVPGALLAGFANLFCIAVVGPLVGRRLLRRWRPDLPKAIADDYAGTVLLWAVCASLLAAGLLHRPAVAGEQADRAAAFAAVHAYVSASAPEYEEALGGTDLMRIEEDLYRGCVPGPEPTRALCLFVRTGQRPAGVTLDPDRMPNDAYRRHGGFG